jgi:hypothetical protein
LMQKSVGLQRFPHFQKVHFTKLMVEQSCWRMPIYHFEMTLFLHGLLVMPRSVCLVNHYIKFILYLAYQVIVLHCHSWTLWSDVVLWKSGQWSLP